MTYIQWHCSFYELEVLSANMYSAMPVSRYACTAWVDVQSDHHLYDIRPRFSAVEEPSANTAITYLP